MSEFVSHLKFPSGMSDKTSRFESKASIFQTLGLCSLLLGTQSFVFPGVLAS